MAYTCYACNTFYPQQDPYPFWICDKCKQKRNEHPPLLPMYWIINPREQDNIREATKQNKQGDR